MFYFGAPQTIIGLYAASHAGDHPVHVFYTEQPEALQFLTFARRHSVTLQNDPDKLNWQRLRAATVRTEYVLENHKRFLPVFSALVKEYPWAEATMLKDA